MLQILEHIKRDGRSTVTELADHFDLPKSTVQMYLNTLYSAGFLVKSEAGYDIGLQFLEYGMSVLLTEPIFPLIKPKLEGLAAETGELASCFVEEHGDAVYIYGVEGDHSISTDLTIGERAPLHATASGKAILASLPEDRISELVGDRALESVTGHTITNLEDLRSELEAIRERGYAVSDQESVVGMRAIAAPVLVDGRVFGAIGLAAPASRFTSNRIESELSDIVTGAANEIELNLTYSASGI